MKIRNGFVSNSSSSSFIIVMKNNQKLTKESLIESFEVSEKSPLFGFAENLAKFLANEATELTIDKLYNNYISSTNKPVDEEINELVNEISFIDRNMMESIKNDKIKVYEGSAWNDGDDSIASYLYENDFQFDTVKITMKNI